MAEDESDMDVGLPQKALNQMTKQSLPTTRIANQTRDMLHNCCLEFIKVLSTEAQRVSTGDHRKTICHEHVRKALENMGFGADFCEVADSVLSECQEQADKRLKRKNSRLDKCGIPEEELLRQQQLLIEKARLEQAETEADQLAQFQRILAQQGAEQDQSSAANADNMDEDYDVE